MKELTKKLKTIKSLDIEAIQLQADVLSNKVLIDAESRSIYINLQNHDLIELSEFFSNYRYVRDIRLDHDKVSCENLLELCNSVSLPAQIQVLKIHTFKNKLENKVLNIKSKRSGKNAFI